MQLCDNDKKYFAGQLKAAAINALYCRKHVPCSPNTLRPSDASLKKSQKIAFQVPFSVYVNVTGSGKGKQSVGDGGTVASGASGSSKGTKATAVSEASNVSGVKLRYIILVHTCISCRFCFRLC